MLSLQDKQIYFASAPIDFRMSIDGLSGLIQREKNQFIHDGSIYVFYNKNRDKIKCLFWDNNGFVLYYKRLDNCKFKFKTMTASIQSISPDDLTQILSGFDSTMTEHNHIKKLK